MNMFEIYIIIGLAFWVFALSYDTFVYKIKYTTKEVAKYSLIAILLWPLCIADIIDTHIRKIK